ncbi:MAG: hypothetical protein JWN67_4873 [Actinomycetia bacterium]|nr:hypothetical protein [Actinomycetes bacterium]
MNHDRDHEFTPQEVRRNRIQVLLILVPLLFTIVVVLVRAVT